MLLALTIASWRPWGPRGDGAGAPGPLFFQCSKVFGPDRRGARGRPARAESSLITSPATGGQFGGGLGGAYGGVDRPGRRGGLAGQHSGGWTAPPGSAHHRLARVRGGYPDAGCFRAVPRRQWGSCAARHAPGGYPSTPRELSTASTVRHIGAARGTAWPGTAELRQVKCERSDASAALPSSLEHLRISRCAMRRASPHQD